MKAVVLHSPWDLRIEEVHTPALGPAEVVVTIDTGGICGSDLHYYQHGGFGTVHLREPMILGHEISGTVDRVGTSVTRVESGMHVAINPSRPCRVCRSCLEGHSNHCTEMRFYGSAMRFPHVQGAFREEIVVDELQLVRVSDSLQLSLAAMAEPLSVGLHAVNRATSVLGRRVLVTGCGPIGSLLIGALRRAGAAEIVALDVMPAPLACAVAMGADRAIHAINEPEALKELARNGGSFDVLFEASGNPQALLQSLDTLRPRAIAITVGLGGEIALPMNAIVARELEIRGSFRFNQEFDQAVRFLDQGLIDVRPVLTATFSFEKANEAFELALDRTRAMKVQLSFS